MSGLDKCILMAEDAAWRGFSVLAGAILLSVVAGLPVSSAVFAGAVGLVVSMGIRKNVGFLPGPTLVLALLTRSTLTAAGPGSGAHALLPFLILIAIFSALTRVCRVAESLRWCARPFFVGVTVGMCAKLLVFFFPACFGLPFSGKESALQTARFFVSNIRNVAAVPTGLAFLAIGFHEMARTYEARWLPPIAASLLLTTAAAIWAPIVLRSFSNTAFPYQYITLGASLPIISRSILARLGDIALLRVYFAPLTLGALAIALVNAFPPKQREQGSDQHSPLTVSPVRLLVGNLMGGFFKTLPIGLKADEDATRKHSPNPVRLITAIVLALALLYKGAVMIQMVPLPVVAGIGIVVVGVKLRKEFVALLCERRRDAFLTGCATAALVLFLPAHQGVLASFALACLVLVFRIAKNEADGAQLTSEQSDQ